MYLLCWHHSPELAGDRFNQTEAELVRGVDFTTHCDLHMPLLFGGERRKHILNENSPCSLVHLELV